MEKGGKSFQGKRGGFPGNLEGPGEVGVSEFIVTLMYSAI